MIGHEVILVSEKTVETLIAKRFGAAVIERWSRHRATKFYEAFLVAFEQEVKGGRETKTVDQKLQEILADDKRTEILFEAYRAVTFARSKTIGPRIIGLLTAAIVTEGRDATDEEEAIFSAAEELSDAEFRGFVGFLDKILKEVQGAKNAEKPYLEGEAIVIPWSEEVRDSAWRHSRENAIDTTPIDLSKAFGAWASRLGRLGFMTSKVTHREHEYEEDGERHIDQNGVLSIYAFSVTLESSCWRLASLARRAFSMDDGHTSSV